jgi:hypothetical protein
VLVMTMYTPEEKEIVEDIAENAATKAIEGFFLRIGVDVSTPSAVTSMQRDFAQLRVLTESIQLIRKRSIGAAITVLVTGGLGAIWMVIKGVKGL